MMHLWRDRVCYGSSGGGGSGGTQQVTTSQQIPQFEQQYSQSNQDLARSLAAQPFPVYQGELVAGFTPTQQAGQQAALDAANSWQPNLNAANAATVGAMGNGAGATNAGIGAIGAGLGAGGNMVNAGASTIGSAFAGNPANKGVIQSYMSPFVQAALTPQIAALNAQLGQQQNQINAQASGANAFGDARQGVQNSLANFYGNQSMTGLLGSGYNTAYSNALQTAMGEQQLGVQAGNYLGNLGLGQMQAGTQAGSALANIGNQQVAQGLSTGQQLGNLGQLQQQLGIGGANAIYNVGAQQQALQQQADTTAYSLFQAQSQWPYQGLNVRESALSNSPYNMVNQVTYPGANQTATNLGAFAGLAGLLGGGSQAPFGGQAFNSAAAHA
jgi:hypothetical protein